MPTSRMWAVVIATVVSDRLQDFNRLFTLHWRHGIATDRRCNLRQSASPVSDKLRLRRAHQRVVGTSVDLLDALARDKEDDEHRASAR